MELLKYIASIHPNSSLFWTLSTYYNFPQKKLNHIKIKLNVLRCHR